MRSSLLKRRFDRAEKTGWVSPALPITALDISIRAAISEEAPAEEGNIHSAEVRGVSCAEIQKARTTPSR
jgi:hypothetical protein